MSDTTYQYARDIGTTIECIKSGVKFLEAAGDLPKGLTREERFARVLLIEAQKLLEPVASAAMDEWVAEHTGPAASCHSA